MDKLLSWPYGAIYKGAAAGELFQLVTTEDSKPLVVESPIFCLDAEMVSDFAYQGCSGPAEITDDISQWSITYSSRRFPDVELTVVMRVCRHSPIFRFRYALSSDSERKLSKRNEADELRYMEISTAQGPMQVTEIQLSNFNPLVHSYYPIEVVRDCGELSVGTQFAGPLVFFDSEATCGLLAFEHGSQHPNTFLEFAAEQTDEVFKIAIHAVKGNYYNGQPVSKQQPFESVWFQLALVPESKESLQRHYREFILKYMSTNQESRKPYVFYNTWNYQERRKYFDQQPYLSEMNEDRMRQEIEVAHRLGIDVFVIDTGWYIKTGDWTVNPERFSDNLRGIKSLLDSYGMKLGLWFNPTVAAKSSQVVQELPHCIMTRDEQPIYHPQIWETEGSYGMCLASEYSDWFIDKLIRLHDELGVTYFKWDGIGQYACNSPLHWHGNETNSPQERAESYAYELGRQMIRIGQAVTDQRPDVIIDFDVTEAGRFVGLGFLAVGKYFLVNNGPYFHDFDIPKWVKIQPDTINVFFFPGPARPRFCRTGVLYDKYIPSNLFLTHYLPDQPRVSQANSVASLVLGGQGIWGDLIALSDDDVRYLAEQIAKYKRVSSAVVESYPRTVGTIGSSPEIYEKIDPEAGSGMVVFFTVKSGRFRYVTQRLKHTNVIVDGADTWEVTRNQRLVLTVNLDDNDARVVYVLPAD